MLSKTIAAMAAGALAVGSVAAQAAPAPRAPAATKDSEQLVGTTAWVLAAIGLGLVIWGIIELADDDDKPASP